MESLGDVRTPYASTAYVFGPKVGLLVLQAFHESDASGIVQEYELGSAVTHPFLGSEKGLVLADDHTRDAEEDRCTGTHRTRAQGRNEGEGVPVSATSRISKAGDLRMRGWVAALNALVVPARDDLAVGIHQSGTNGDSTLRPGLLRPLDRGIHPSV